MDSNPQRLPLEHMFFSCVKRRKLPGWGTESEDPLGGLASGAYLRKTCSMASLWAWFTWARVS